jgi:hypothetical protein
MTSLATADCGWLVLTTAVPSGARDSRLRVNHRQNRRAGDEREGKCSRRIVKKYRGTRTLLKAFRPEGALYCNFLRVL